MSGNTINPAFRQTSSVITECAQVFHGMNANRVIPGIEDTILPQVSVTMAPVGINHYKQDYFEARQQLEVLIKDTRNARKRLLIFAFTYKYICFGYNLLQNSITLATAIIVSGVFGTLETESKVLAIIAFLLSFSNWFRLGEKSQQNLDESKDLKQAENLCDEVQVLLDEAIADDFIDRLEHDQILEAIRKMYLAAESISFAGMFVNIMADTPIGNNAQKAVHGIRGIIHKVSRKGVKISQVHPNIIREVRSTRSIISIV